MGGGEISATTLPHFFLVKFVKFVANGLVF